MTKVSKTNEVLPKDQWIPFLAGFTRRNRGAHGRLEVLDGEAGDVVEVEGKPFEGVSADVKDGEHTIWVSFGGAGSSQLTHGIHEASALYMLEPSDESGEILCAEAADGSKTILSLSKTGDFALPPKS